MVWDGGLDARYRDALVRPHTAYNRVDVLARDGTVLYSGTMGEGLPFIEGSVRATLTSRVARVLSLTVDRSWFPVLPSGEVDPDGLLSNEERTRRAKHLQRAHMLKLAAASAAARRKR